MENKFNLVDNPWIAVAGAGNVSLMDIFTQYSYRSLGGSPLQKIAMIKLLLAIAQSAVEIEDDQQWYELGWQGLAEKCVDYLHRWHACFDLYGDKPFLQMPAIKAAECKSFSVAMPEISTGNTTILTESQVEKPLTDAQRAQLLVQLMSCSLGGKKTDNSITLTEGYQGKKNEKGKPSTSKPGSAIAYMGLLHNFVGGENLMKTLWLNLLTKQDLARLPGLTAGFGVAPWEQMPAGEDCETARMLRKSLMGRLVPMGRFCLLAGNGMYYSEGIIHPDYKDGVIDPSVAMDISKTKPRVLWTNPQQRPWRQLPALLGFFAQENSSHFNCPQLQLSLPRARKYLSVFSIWSGGLKVSSNAGEQYVSADDNSVESEAHFSTEYLNDAWFHVFKQEMLILEQLSKVVYAATKRYFKALKMNGEKHAANACSLFWQYSEQDAQNLIDFCDDASQRIKLRRRFIDHARQSFNHHCPCETARQLDAWAEARPNVAQYFNKEL